MNPVALHRRALSMLLLATFFWGLSFPAIKSIALLQARLLPEASAWFSTLYIVTPRFVLALAIMLLLRPRAAWPLSRGELKQGLVIGLFAAAGMLFQNDGLQYTAASTSAFLTQLYAILIPVWLALRARHNPGVRVWICCLLVLMGVTILGHFDWHALHFGRGESETLLSSAFFMGQILWLEKKEFAANDPWRLTLVTFAVQAVIFLGLALAAAPSQAALLRPWTSAAWFGLVALLTICCTIGAYWLMNTWQPRISATEAGLIYCFEPIFASILAGFLPGWISRRAEINYPSEHVTVALLVGGGLITIANILLQIRRPGGGTGAGSQPPAVGC